MNHLRQSVAVLALVLTGWGQLAAAAYYVSVDGRPSNAGTINSPWDRASVAAEGNPKRISCGDTINLRGGVYDGPIIWHGAFSCAGNHVIIQNQQGEVALFDNSTFSALLGASSPSANLTTWTTSAWLWFRSNPIGTGYFGLTNTNPKTNFSGAEWGPPGCYPSCRPGAVVNLGDFNRFSGLRVFNTGQGFADQSGACGTEYVENIVANVGFESTERGADAGEAFYIQNVDPETCLARKILRGNVTFSSFDAGAQVYGSSGSYITNVDVDGHVCFQHSRLAADSEGSCLLIGGIGSAVVRDIRVTNSFFVNTTPGFPRWAGGLRFYMSPCVGCTIRGNYSSTVAGSGYALTAVNALTGLVESGNRFVGQFQSDTADDQFPQSTFVAEETTNRVVERWGALHSGFGYLVIVNGTGAATVSYTPTCSSGAVALYEMMNFRAEQALHVFPCDGLPHAVATAYSGPVMQPTRSSRPLLHTGNRFRVFLLARSIAPAAMILPPADLRYRLEDR